MKKLISILLLFTMLMSLLASCGMQQGQLDLGEYPADESYDAVAYTSRPAWNGTTVDKSWYTSNTSAATFYLADGADLKGFVDLVAAGTTFAGKTVKLKNDINLGGKTWIIPTSNNYFQGTFDGQNYEIGGFTSTFTSESNQSLLGAIGGAATVKNLKVVKGQFTLKPADAATSNFGIVISKITGVSGKTVTVSNVTVDATSKIARSTADGIKGVTNVGGIIGSASGAGTLKIEKCTNNAPLTNKGNYTAGIVGVISGWKGTLTISGCINNGKISGASYTAGIIGGLSNMDGTATISGCTNNGALIMPNGNSGNRMAGILPNYTGKNNSKLTIDQCTNTGSITYDSMHGTGGSNGAWIAGIGGYFYNATSNTAETVVISNCTNTGKILGANRCSGGILGAIQGTNNFTMKNCTVNADMEFICQEQKYSAFGGLAGNINLSSNATPAVIENCSVAGTIHHRDPIGNITYVGGLIGVARATTFEINGCEVSARFVRGEGCGNDDYAGVVLGGYSDGATTGDAPTLTSTKSFFTVTDLAYIAKDSFVRINDFIDPSEISCFKPIGQQYRKNANGTYDVRFVFGIGKIETTDKALGFEVTIKKLDKEVTTTTKKTYCSVLYKTIQGDNVKYSAAQYGCDYLYTLTLSGVPADQIDFAQENGYTVAYIKNAILDIVPFTQETEESEPNRGHGILNYTKNPERFTFGYEAFSVNLPEKFAGVQGILTGKKITYSTPKNLDCQNYKKLGSNDQYILQYDCVCGGECDAGWSANGATAYKNAATMPYHYYIDTTTYEKASYFGETLDRYEAYHSWDFEVAEDGYYEFCFRIRLNGTNGNMQTRYALVQLDDQSYGNQTELYYNVEVQDGANRDNATNHNAYIVGYGAYLTAGKHSITFRSPYDSLDAKKDSSFHIRDIYLVKGAPLPVNADIPLPTGAQLYESNYDSCVTYYLENTTLSTLTTYRAKLQKSGFTLQDQRQTSYKFSSFDTQNYTSNKTMYNNFYLYTNEDYMVYVYYTEGAKSIRIVVDYVDAYEKYAEVNDENETYTEVTTPMFAMLDIGGPDLVLTKGANKGKTVTGVSNGLCLVYRLSDGRFIIVDGGHWKETDTEGEAVERLYNWLQKNDHLPGENNTITIAAWIVTHHHSDHISVMFKFEQMYQGKGAVIQNYLYNFPSYEYVSTLYGSNYRNSNFTYYYPNTTHATHSSTNLVAHTGFTYQFADCTIDILHTHEDFAPEKIFSYNNSSTVFKITLAGKTFLVAGDLEEPGQKRAIKQSGTLLESDFLQVTHHGGNGQIEFYKYIVGLKSNGQFNTDTIVVWPLPKGESMSYYEGTSARAIANQWLRDMFRNENDLANDNIFFAVENYVFTDFD